MDDRARLGALLLRRAALWHRSEAVLDAGRAGGRPLAQEEWNRYGFLYQAMRRLDGEMQELRERIQREGTGLLEVRALTREELTALCRYMLDSNRRARQGHS
jgi:hypothetical protein